MKCHICGAGGFKGHQGVKMHIGRVHENTINPNRALSLAARRRRRLQQMEGITALDAEPGVAVAISEPQSVVATTTKRTVSVEETKITVPAPSKKFEVNGCPNCLFPLRTMNADLARHGIEPPPFCPNCTFPVDVVRTAIRLANKHNPVELVTQ
jgi:hypothetical protein